MTLIQGTDLHYEYRGYQYRTYEDREDDNVKLFHLCFRNGQEVRMPYEFYRNSPYSLIAPEDFQKHVNSLEVFINSRQ